MSDELANEIRELNISILKVGIAICTCIMEDSQVHPDYGPLKTDALEQREEDVREGRHHRQEQ